MNLLAELKRRNVIRMAGLYLVGAWLITQVAGTVLPMFGAPDWIARAVVILLAIGFLPTLVIAWVFELTPEGLKRDAEVPAQESIAPQTAQRMNRTITALLVAALAYFAVDKFVLTSQREAPPLAQTGATAPAPTVAAASTPELGVAVLPFNNFSPDPDNAFFASGVFDEVLTRVSRIDGLRVISRTSMEQIATDKLGVPQIGRRLGVSHVLEGSVQRAGDRVRITVHLIEAATDRHVWAEKYDRTLDDVFAIQSEISLAIADQLQIALSPKQQAALGERATSSPQAYDLYLRALDERRTWRGASGIRDIIALVEPAVKLDPDFLRARVLLVEAYARMGWLWLDSDGAFDAKAQEHLRALEARWPERIESRQARAIYLYCQRDYAAALALLQPLAKQHPNDAWIAGHVANSLKRLRRYPEHLQAAKHAVAINPESSAALAELARAHLNLGQIDQAQAIVEDGLRRFPTDKSSAMLLAMIKFLYRNDNRPLLALASADVLQDPDSAHAIAQARFLAGDVDGAVAALDPWRLAAGDERRFEILGHQARYLKLAGRTAEARAMAQHAYQQARTRVEAGLPNGDRGVEMLASAASAAALAGEEAQARAWETQALALPVKSIESNADRTFARVNTRLALGDVDGAWALRLQLLTDGPAKAVFLLPVLRPLQDALFGKSAAYRAYVAAVDSNP